MSRTITAMFDSASDAAAAKSRLTASRIDADNVRVIDKSTSQGSGSGGGHDEGFLASIKHFFLPDEDAHAYGEGIRRGGYMLCAEVDEDQADEAVRILDESNSVDFDSRQEEWRNDGWGGYTSGYTDTGTPSGGGMGASGLGTMASTGSSGMGYTETGSTGRSGMTDTDSLSGRAVEEERIPVMEEELRVGKREVTRGGARVRSYIREIPVHEQVRLREEHVSVERRPVSETLRSGDLDTGDMLRDRTIEMTETAEEAVIGKEARVVEEVVVRKTAEERVEEIDDTVRRTEVEVDEGLNRDSDRSAFSDFGGRADKSGSTASDPLRTDYAGTDRDRL
jgi:uncharacterized protein (TIGR02271 family)